MKKKRLIISASVCVAIAILAFFADKIPFYEFPQELRVFPPNTVIHVDKLLSAEHFRILVPVLIILVCTFIGIVLVRKFLSKGKYSFTGVSRGHKVVSRFMVIRWISMITLSFLMIFGGALLNARYSHIAIPVFACPVNFSELTEASCYYLAHTPALLEEGFLAVAAFFVTTILFAWFFGRTLCGFFCPMGLTQDVMYKIRQALKIDGFAMSDKKYKYFVPVKWTMILLFLGLIFIGGDFCNFCPAVVLSPIMSGIAWNLYLSGFFMIIVLIASFFKRRFFCNICPLGYLVGLLHRFQPFKIKKDCTACTECGACYEACPMGIKQIYTEREKVIVSDANCIMCGECIRCCPEDNALSMTFFNKKLYTAKRSRVTGAYKHKQNTTITIQAPAAAPKPKKTFSRRKANISSLMADKEARVGTSSFDQDTKLSNLSLKKMRMKTNDREVLKNQKKKKLFNEKAMHTAQKYLRRMSDLGSTMAEMDPFFDVLNRVYVDMKDVSEPGVKSIGTYCVMAPQELIYAAGGKPIKLCSGSYTAFSIGDDIVPRDACPLVKAVAGYKDIGTMPIYDDCAMMVVPITCDCKKKIAGMLSDQCNTCTLHVPVNKEDVDIDDYTNELYTFADKLAEVTGHKITYESLSAAFNKTGYAQYELSRFLKIKKQHPYLIYGTHAMAVMNASAYLDAGTWGKYMHALNKALTEKAARKERVNKKNIPRIMITGSPIVFPNIKIPLLIEEAGGYVAADETCMGERGQSDPVVPVDESYNGLMRSLAIRALRPCSCPTFSDNSQRIYRINQMIKDYHVQGVIYHVLRGCLVYDYEYKIIEDELAKFGIPVIRLESDYNEEDVEQLKIRIEAFIEMIKLKNDSKNKEKKQRGLL